jgi:putative ABC transport system substrate-binding protein
MRRRDLIILASGAASFGASAFAQNSSTPLIGFLSSKGEAAETTVIKGMSIGLADQGIILGKDAAITARWSDGQYERLPALAADLIAAKVNVLVTSGLPATMAAKTITTKIPIVFRHAVDPVSFKLVQSLDRPGGNLTGVTMLFDPLTPKKLQLMHELVSANQFAYLLNPKNKNANSHRQHAQEAARTLNLDLTMVTASSAKEFSTAFATAQGQNAAALLVGDDPLYDVENNLLIRAAEQAQMPTMYYVRDFVIAGGLISYGPRFEDLARQMGAIIGRIIKGANPAEVPVEQPTKFELLINLKAASRINFDISTSFLARADELIEQ